MNFMRQEEGLRMKDGWTETSCRAFTEALASGAPVPGGGGAAALTGAFGAALCAMAGNLTLGRKRYASVQDDVRRLLELCEGRRVRLLELVEEDAAGFEPLSRSYAIPKDEPSRDKALEDAARLACRAPLEIMEACCRTVSALEEMLDKGSAALVSDVGCGALCAAAALESAGLNVFVNTRTLRDRAAAEELDARARGMLEEYLPRARRVADETRRRLCGED